MTQRAKKSMRLSLRAGEKIYVNGAILTVDRKVNLALLNDATFLLENHVLQHDATGTPLRQLYFVVQTMLIEPKNAEVAKLMFRGMIWSTIRLFEEKAIVDGLGRVNALVEDDELIEALKHLRGLFPIEEQRLASCGQAPSAMTEPIALAPAGPAGASLHTLHTS